MPSVAVTSNLLATGLGASGKLALDDNSEHHVSFFPAVTIDLHTMSRWHFKKLKKRLRLEAKEESDISCPIDLNEVNTRLLNVPSEYQPPAIGGPTPEPITRSPLAGKELRLSRILEETIAYNKLVQQGGRPSHPLDRIQHVAKDPGEYKEILSFWRSSASWGTSSRSSPWEVFDQQWRRWRDFRRLQRFARGQSIYHYYRGIWEDRWQERLEDIAVSGGLMSPYGSHTEDDWNREWNNEYHRYLENPVIKVSGQSRFWKHFVHRRGKDSEQHGFPEYVEALKERLARNGFSRTFHLNEDPDQQDQLTTWIEYLAYEYWWYEEHQGWYKNSQRRQDRAFNTLIDSGALKPDETDEVVRGYEFFLKCRKDRGRARWFVGAAQREVESATRQLSLPQTPSIPEEQLQQHLLQAQTALSDAQMKFEVATIRLDSIPDLKRRINSCRAKKRVAGYQEIMIQWMLQQIPMIELELETQNVLEDKSEEADSRVRIKRKRSDQPNEADQPKEHDSDGETERVVSGVAAPLESDVRDSHDVRHDTRPSKRVKFDLPSPGMTNDSICCGPSAGKEDIAPSAKADDSSIPDMSPRKSEASVPRSSAFQASSSEC